MTEKRICGLFTKASLLDDLVKSKISPPLAGGDDGEGDK
jgi:hypothetical protein